MSHPWEVLELGELKVAVVKILYQLAKTLRVALRMKAIGALFQRHSTLSYIH